jgi:hypothetical protein
MGQADAAAISVRSGCDQANRLAARDRSVVEWRAGLRGRCLAARARLALARNAPLEAASLSSRLASLYRAELSRGRSIDAQVALAEAEMLRAQVAERLGQREAATASWNAAAAAWPRNVELKPSELGQQALVLRRLGRKDDSDRIVRQLAAIGYRHPTYVRDQQSNQRT